MKRDEIRTNWTSRLLLLTSFAFEIINSTHSKTLSNKCTWIFSARPFLSTFESRYNIHLRADEKGTLQSEYVVTGVSHQVRS